MKQCKICGKKLSYNNKSGYCAPHLIETRRKEKVEKWLKTGNTGMTVDTTIRGAIRDYILSRQEYKCAICGMKNEWNGKQLNFILDHINGNAADSSSENVRLICPNCDS